MVVGSNPASATTKNKTDFLVMRKPVLFFVLIMEAGFELEGFRGG